MVLSRLPLTMTGRARAVEDCAWDARNKEQPQKKMPLAAAPLRKTRRAVIACPSLQVQTNNPRALWSLVHSRAECPVSCAISRNDSATTAKRRVMLELA